MLVHHCLNKTGIHSADGHWEGDEWKWFPMLLPINHDIKHNRLFLNAFPGVHANDGVKGDFIDDRLEWVHQHLPSAAWAPQLWNRVRHSEESWWDPLWMGVLALACHAWEWMLEVIYDECPSCTRLTHDVPHSKHMCIPGHLWKGHTYPWEELRPQNGW